MARLFYRKYQNHNDKLSSNGKYYGRIVHVDTLTTSDLCRHMAKHGTIFTPDVVKGVVEKFVCCFEELLLEGHKVKLDGLGTFYLTAKSKGEEKEEDFTAENFESLRVRFLPDQSKQSEYTSMVMRRKANFVLIDGDKDEDGGGDNP